jgi:predicted nucleotidyltransferase
MSLSSKAQEVFSEAGKRAEEGLTKMRSVAAEVFGDDDRFIVGVNGSYARREVTGGSDVDLFVLYRQDAIIEAQTLQAALREKLEASGFKMPASGGVFSSPLTVSMLTQSIGGMDDTNEYITRRMLLLLEGEWIYNRSEFERARMRLLDQYVAPTIRSEQICLFLLNDIIRYWRTICVDFEYKVQSDNKPREIRLIKLRFSRMLLFFAGVIAVGATYELDRAEKVHRLSELLSAPPHQRLRQLAGEKAYPALELYAEFLNALDDNTTRDTLQTALPPGQESPAFMELRRKAQKFRDSLLEVLHSQFDKGNPTLAALML